jgi:hypothetical protein
VLPREEAVSLGGRGGRVPCLSADGGRRAADGSGLGAQGPPQGGGLGEERVERGEQKENDAWGPWLVVDMEFEL